MVQWAPLATPLERRLQTLAVVMWELMQLACMILFVALVYYWPMARPPAVCYLVWMLAIDGAPQRGGRKVHWIRRLGWFRYFAAYFPGRLVKTGDLDERGNYIFCYHPHGIIGVGANIAFASEGAGFAALFPGVDVSFATISANFRIPLFRDFALAVGLVDCSRASCDAVLESGPGRSLALCVGGAAESLDARPGVVRLTLRKRLGFVRLALAHGASLVPCIGFGENELFSQASNEPGTRVRAWQQAVLRATGFTVPLFFGRGALQYSYGLVPYRRPITVVFGEPLHVPRMAPERIDDAAVARVHSEYVLALQALYERHRAEYGAADVPLEIVA